MSNLRNAVSCQKRVRSSIAQTRRSKQLRSTSTNGFETSFPRRGFSTQIFGRRRCLDFFAGQGPPAAAIFNFLNARDICAFLIYVIPNTKFRRWQNRCVFLQIFECVANILPCGVTALLNNECFPWYSQVLDFFSYSRKLLFIITAATHPRSHSVCMYAPVIDMRSSFFSVAQIRRHPVFFF